MAHILANDGDGMTGCLIGGYEETRWSGHKHLALRMNTDETDRNKRHVGRELTRFSSIEKIERERLQSYTALRWLLPLRFRSRHNIRTFFKPRLFIPVPFCVHLWLRTIFF
jgi:hypothetical protein